MILVVMASFGARIYVPLLDSCSFERWLRPRALLLTSNERELLQPVLQLIILIVVTVLELRVGLAKESRLFIVFTLVAVAT